MITDVGTTSGVTPTTFTTSTEASGTGAVIASADIVAALNAGNSVTISTGSTGTEAGDITVSNANLVASPSTPVTLRLEAARDILVTDSSFGSGNTTAVSLNLQAGTGGNFQGRIAVSGTSVPMTINTQGGDVTMRGYGYDSLVPGSVNAVDLQSVQINAGTGKVDITNGWSDYLSTPGTGITLGNSTITAGEINLEGISVMDGVADAAAWGIRLNNSGLTAGTITVRGSAYYSGGTATSTGVAISGSSIDSGSGSIVIDGQVLVTASGAGGAGLVVNSNSLITGAQVGLYGNASAPTRSARGVELAASQVTASESLSVIGYGYGTGVWINPGSLLELTPAASGSTGILEINGTSSRTVAAGGDDDSHGIYIAANPSSPSLRATNGASIYLNGNNQNLSAALKLTGGVGIDAATGTEVRLRGGPAGATNPTAEIDANIDAGLFVWIRSDNVSLAGSFSTIRPFGSILVTGADTGNTQQFFNNGVTFDTPGGGSWLIYGQDPASTQTGSLAYAFRQFNSTFEGAGAQPLMGGSGVLYSQAQSLTVSGSSLSKTYDGSTTSLPLDASGLSITSSLAGTSASLVAGSTGTYASKDAGLGQAVSLDSSAIGVTDADGKPLLGFGVTSNILGDILPRTLTLDPLTVADRVYNGTTTATLTPSSYSLSGLVGSESLIINQTVGLYDSANAGARTVTVSLAPADYSAGSGTLLGNYTLPTSASGSGTIVPRSLTYSFVAGNRAYDGSTGVNVSSANLEGLLSGESLSVTGTFSADSANAGSGRVASWVFGSLVGTATGLASNYVVPTKAATSTFTITPAPLTITANNASKVFGTTLSFAGTEFTSSPLVGGQTVGSVTLTSAGAASTASVAGGPYSIVPSAATGGTFNAANYQISYVNGSLTVTPASLTALLASIVGNPSKVYDGSSTAVLTSANYSLTGFVGSDSANITQTVGQYDSANAGTRTVTATLGAGNFVALGSTNLSNYSLPTSASGSGTITPRPLTVIGITANNKVYDGNTLATVASLGSLNGLVGTQTLGLVNTSASFNTADAGTGKTVTVTGLTLSNGSNGGLASNYVLGSSAATTTADISRAPLTITANNASKVFGTTLSFAGTEFTTSPLVGGQTVGSVTLTSAGAAASASVAGGPYSIIPSAATGGTFNPANYQISYVNGVLTVTPANLSAVLVSIVGNPTKVYDGSTVATLAPVNYTLTGFAGSDAATINQTVGQYDSANAGNRTVTATLAAGNYTPLGSTDLRNYTLPTSASGSGTITPRPLTVVGITANNKVYDGNVLATLSSSGSLSGLVGTQTLGLVNTSASFNTADAGTGKTVTVTGLTLSNGSNGGLASNYVLGSSAATTTADITPAPLTITANNASKVFGNTLSFAGTEFTTSPLVGGQTVGSVTLTSAGAAASASVAGGPYSIIPSAATGGTFNPANYQISYVNGVLTVTPANLSAVLVSIVGNPSKVYDGTTVATLAPANYTLTGFIGSDAATINQTIGQYDSANAGNRTVTATLAASNFTAAGQHRPAQLHPAHLRLGQRHHHAPATDGGWHHCQQQGL